MHAKRRMLLKKFKQFATTQFLSFLSNLYNRRHYVFLLLLLLFKRSRQEQQQQQQQGEQRQQGFRGDGGQSDALPLCSLSHTPSPISMLTKAARALQIKTTTTNMSKTNKKLVSLTHTCTQAPAHAPHTSKLIHTHTLSLTHTRKQAPIDRSHAHFCANFSPTHARALSHTRRHMHVLSCSY